MTRAPYESAAAPTSHSAADPAEFNVLHRTKSNLPNRTDSNAALLISKVRRMNGTAFETGLSLCLNLPSVKTFYFIHTEIFASNFAL